MFFMTVKEKNKFIEAYNLIKKSKNILLVSHRSPDEDTISSSCALSLFLDKLDKKYSIFCADKINKSFLFLPNAYKISNNLDNFNEFDLIIVSDCGDASRTGIKDLLFSRKKNQKIIEFDHHVKVDDYADIEIKKPDLASATEVLYWFFYFNDLKIDKKTANCLLFGILSDTSNFAHSHAGAQIIDITSKLIKKGAQFNKLSKILDSDKYLPSMKLWGIALNNLKYNKKYKIVFSVLTNDDIKDFKPKDKIYTNIINSLNSIKGANIAILFKEKENGKISVSLRSNSNVDVSKLANCFGGGGHAKASGFIIDGRIQKNGLGYFFER